MSVNKAHDKLGHADEAATQKAAKEQGVKIVRGSMKSCAACTVGKAKQKNVPKTSEHKPATSDKEDFFWILP
jgi:hypothetical protein